MTETVWLSNKSWTDVNTIYIYIYISYLNCSLPAAEYRTCLHTTVASEMVHEVSEIVLHDPK